MVDLDNVSRIEAHLKGIFNNLSTGIQSQLSEMIVLEIINVENFTGASIDNDGIPEKYRHAIVNLVKADIVDLVNAQTGGGANIKLAELSISDTQDILSADQYRKIADMSLKNIGRKINFARSIS